MAKTNSERQKDFRDRQDKKAKAGVELYVIFSAHASAIAPLLSKEERTAMNQIGDVLENA
jgi:hypothetical protein